MNDESVLVGTTLDMPLVPVREDGGTVHPAIGHDDGPAIPVQMTTVAEVAPKSQTSTHLQIECAHILIERLAEPSEPARQASRPPSLHVLPGIL